MPAKTPEAAFREAGRIAAAAIRKAVGPADGVTRSLRRALAWAETDLAAIIAQHGVSEARAEHYAACFRGGLEDALMVDTEENN